ncbi:uncharacterized protein F5147DRAFT_787195 [Suillus discolor]|uniref:Uncharacterized protein n=1 Tax=Suillus discolor TaxID=1912936 RepID=A0A9P7EU66_9AGAM|nr:uncharacterized protein F5147DRAFT_787195 [Suillus discolor]KAG2090474.1 hypothetical protein F5147DRAFT_787195 [Suillus discolor]
MPKCIPTPSPGEDEPHYLTVIHPYILDSHCNMELPKDRQDFACWVACCIDAKYFYTFFYKPSISGGVDRLCSLVNAPNLIAYSHWKTGAEELLVEDAWFKMWSPNNQHTLSEQREIVILNLVYDLDACIRKILCVPPLCLMYQILLTGFTRQFDVSCCCCAGGECMLRSKISAGGYPESRKLSKHWWRGKKTAISPMLEPFGGNVVEKQGPSYFSATFLRAKILGNMQCATIMQIAVILDLAK